MQLIPSPADQSSGDGIVDALVRLGKAMRHSLRAGIDQHTYWTLSLIALRGPLRLRELAEASGLDNSTVSRQVCNLEQRGWLQRTPDPHDGRAQLIDLSDAGREVLADSRRQRRELLLTLLGTWSEQDIADLERLMGRLADEVEHFPASPQN